MATAKELETMRKNLRNKLRTAVGDVSVAAADLNLLLEEVGRLQQSNDRLRRQNRRVRIKLQKAGLADDVADAPDGEEGEP